MHEDTRAQLLALRQLLDDVLAEPAVPADLGALVRVADGVTEVLLREIARARAEAPAGDLRDG